jgi:hypothetical protein
VSGTITVRCDLNPATEPSCVDYMWYIVEPGSIAWATSPTSTATKWDTTTVPNGTKTIECATESTLRGAFAADIVVTVKN